MQVSLFERCRPETVPAAAQPWRVAKMTAPPSFAELIHRAAAIRPDDPAVADGAQGLSWQQLADQVAQLAAGFAGTGLRPDDRVAIQAASSVEFVLCYL